MRERSRKRASFRAQLASKAEESGPEVEEGTGTMTKILMNTVLVFLLGVGMFAVAQEDQRTQGDARQDMHEAGSDVKSAAHHAARGTKRGAKKAVRATKRGTRRVVHKTAEETGEGADKVRDKTQ
jgi:hypothetical protein